MSSTTRKLNVAIIGFGLSGRVFHASLISSLHDCFNLKMIQTVNNKKDAQLMYPDATIVDNTDVILQDESIDLVVITSTNTTHFPLAKRCMEAKKHVVVEKPFTVNSEEARELIRIAEKNAVVLSVYHNRRWDGDFLTVKQLIESGTLGRVVEYESHFDRFRNELKANAWRENADLAGSGILFDLGAHLIDQALMLFGVPDTVTADLRMMRDNCKTVDYFDVQLGYKQVKVTLKSTSLSRELTPKFIVHGTNGSFIKYGLDPQEDVLKSGRKPIGNELATWGSETSDKWGKLNTTIPNTNLHVEGKVETMHGCYHKYYQNIYLAITSNTPLQVTAEQGLRVIQMIELAEQSNREKRTIAVNV